MHLLLQSKTSPATMQVIRKIEANRLDMGPYAQSFHDRAQKAS